ERNVGEHRMQRMSEPHPVQGILGGAAGVASRLVGAVNGRAKRIGERVENGSVGQRVECGVSHDSSPFRSFPDMQRHRHDCTRLLTIASAVECRTAALVPKHENTAPRMYWLLLGILYSFAYIVAGFLLRD